GGRHPGRVRPQVRRALQRQPRLRHGHGRAVRRGDELISLRSRTGAFRPLTVVRELEAEAQKQYFGKIQALEEEVQKTSAKLQELQKAQGGAAGKSAQILSPEQQAEMERFRKTVAEARLALKEVRKNLRQ